MVNPSDYQLEVKDSSVKQEMTALGRFKVWSTEATEDLHMLISKFEERLDPFLMREVEDNSSTSSNSVNNPAKTEFEGIFQDHISTLRVAYRRLLSLYERFDG